MNRTITSDFPFRICFVCLGNICRSPTAEGVFQHLVMEKKLDSFFYIDSAGTSAWHIGEPANSKSQKTANQYGVTLPSRARRFESSDLDDFDLIIAMDHENLENLHQLDRDQSHRDKIKLMREFDSDPGNREVPDPYYGGMQGFDNVFQIIKRSCETLLAQLESRIQT